MSINRLSFATRVLASTAAIALVFQLNTEPASARDSVSKFQRKFVEVTAGKIFRGIQPGDEEDYEYLRIQGVRTTLNLRKYLKWQEKNLHEKADAHGFFYRHTGMPTLWNEPKDAEVDEALHDLNDPALQPIYVHCRLGKDRTGLIVALHRVLDEQWTPCDAWKEWKSFGYLPWNDGLKDYFEKRVRTDPQIPARNPLFKVSNCSS
jgi:protein tyrosine/serine phosphatase